MKSLVQFINESANPDTGEFKMTFKDFFYQVGIYLKDTIEKTDVHGKKYTDLDLDKFISDFSNFKLIPTESYGGCSKSDLYKDYNEHGNSEVTIRKVYSGKEYRYFLKAYDNELNFHFDTKENIPLKSTK